MADYLASRIMDGAYTYDYVISKRPDLQPGIDAYLTLKDKEELIVQ